LSLNALFLLLTIHSIRNKWWKDIWT
jgi:hypothetical protein